MKFVLFLPTRRKCWFYYQQLNVPKFKTIVTWIFEGFFPFLSSLLLYSQFSFQIMANKIPGSGAKWEEGELDQLEFWGQNHFSCDRMTETDVELLTCCSGSCLSTSLASLKGEQKALYWRFQQEYETKASQKCSFLFAANTRVFGGFLSWCSLPEKSPELPIAPLIREKLKAFRFCQMMRVWFPPKRNSPSALMTLLNQLDHDHRHHTSL